MCKVIKVRNLDKYFSHWIETTVEYEDFKEFTSLRSYLLKLPRKYLNINSFQYVVKKDNIIINTGSSIELNDAFSRIPINQSVKIGETFLLEIDNNKNTSLDIHVEDISNALTGVNTANKSYIGCLKPFEYLKVNLEIKEDTDFLSPVFAILFDVDKKNMIFYTQGVKDPKKYITDFNSFYHSIHKKDSST